MHSSLFLTVSDAASDLGVNESRVRALLQAERLEGVKLGGRWLVDARSVWRRKRAGASHGRRLRPRNAWGLLSLASGDEAPWLSAEERYRVRRLLEDNELGALSSRLEERAKVRRFRAHPGVLRRLSARPRLALTGVSAASARGLELIAGQELDAYLAHGEVEKVVREFALSASDDDANVVLREMPVTLWPFRDRLAPLAAIALDLAEDSDARGARIAERTLAELTAAHAWRARSADPPPVSMPTV